MLDLINQKFGRLTVISEAPRVYDKSNHSRRMWNCIFDCGNKKIVPTERLKSGITKSCGCLRSEVTIKKSTTHGKSRTRLYKIFKMMVDRCYNHSSSAYQHYGGREIKICQEWMDDFMNFYNWAMANGYKENLTIERVNVNGNYCPENCKWITQNEQMRNRTNTHFVKYRGEIMTLSEASRKFNIDRGTIRKYEKIFDGDAEKAIDNILHNSNHIRKINNGGK